MSIANPIGFWVSSRYENGIEDSRKPRVMAPVSLMFLSVPVSSCALAWPAENAAAKARPIIRRCFIRCLPFDRFRRDGCTIPGGIECGFFGPSSRLGAERTRHLTEIPEQSRHDAERFLRDR